MEGRRDAVLGWSVVVRAWVDVQTRCIGYLREEVSTLGLTKYSDVSVTDIHAQVLYLLHIVHTRHLIVELLVVVQCTCNLPCTPLQLYKIVDRVNT